MEIRANVVFDGDGGHCGRLRPSFVSLARPFLRRSTGFEAGAVAVLSCVALALWAVVVPLEFALRLTV
jgi:hypothetical protein